MNRFGLILSMLTAGVVLLSCSGKQPSTACSKVKAVAFQKNSNEAGLSRFLGDFDGAGGELVIEFRKQDPLGPVDYQKSCSFYLEPIQASEAGGVFWTAGHCLDPSRDSRYRLRFFIDLQTGYVEIPVEVEQLTQTQKLRDSLSRRLSSAAQTEILAALKQREVQYTESNNATDICLDSIKRGRTFWHEPLAGMNQISCFLYQDLRTVEFKYPPNLTQTQRNMINFMNERVKKFDETTAISRATTLTFEERTENAASFRQNWLKSYKLYTEYRENDNFQLWIKETRQKCSQSSRAEKSQICEKWSDIREAFTESGLTMQSKLLEDESENNFSTEYLSRKRNIVDLWRFLGRSTVDGSSVKLLDAFRIVSNFFWSNGNLRTFSTITLGSFIGLNWGSTIGESGQSRDRVGGATYNWNSEVNETFFYMILPKNQTTENLDLGYGQLKLQAGDSGSMLLGGGLPMAVLATVDGEKTSGGASFMPLPVATSEDTVDQPNTPAGPVVSIGGPSSASAASNNICL